MNDPPSKDDIVAGLLDTWAATGDLTAELPEEAWDLPTDCPGWTVRDHVAHVVGTELGLLGRPLPEPPAAYGDHVQNEIGQYNERWVQELRSRPGADVRAQLVAATAERGRALVAMGDADFAAESWTPAGPGTYGDFMRIRVFDCWVHEQDVRRAVGRPGHLSGPAVDVSFWEARRAMPYVVGRRARAPEGSTVAFRLDGEGAAERRFAVGVVDGRGRLVDPPADGATATVATDVEAFMALACGRWDPAPHLTEGRVRVEGDGALGRAVVEHLAFTI